MKVGCKGSSNSEAFMAEIKATNAKNAREANSHRENRTT